MKIVHLTYSTGHENPTVAFVRDPVMRGRFLCGIECNHVGVGIREGCQAEHELRVLFDRIIKMEDVTPDA